MANLLTNINQVCADLTNIKNAIVDNGVSIEAGTPSSDYAEKINNVYSSGVAYADEAITETNSGLEAVLYGTGEGGKSYYDMFWDAIQKKGKRLNYNYAFFSNAVADSAWNDDNFRPKYPIVPTSAASMLQATSVTGDITKKATFDFYQCTSIMNAFYYATKITRLGVIDCRAAKEGHINFASYCYELETIDEIILKDDGTQFNSATTWSFARCDKLKNIKITGKTPSNCNVNFTNSPLTKASFESVINALYEGSTGKTATFNKAAKEVAFTTEEWNALIATKPNWTFSLV